MFSGITQGLFPVVSITPVGTRRSLEIDLAGNADRLALGASVAVDGVCLTVAGLSGATARFDVIEETLRRTTLSNLRAGDLVSVERSLTNDTELGGHAVSGHVTATGEIRIATDLRGSVGSAPPSGAHVLRIAMSPESMKYLFPQGFVALDGSSLTVVRLHPDGFEVHLIPETLRRTKLSSKRAGHLVNVELDARTVAVVDTVERVLEPLLEPAIERVLERSAGTETPGGIAAAVEASTRPGASTGPPIRRGGGPTQDPD